MTGENGKDGAQEALPPDGNAMPIEEQPTEVSPAPQDMPTEMVEEQATEVVEPVDALPTTEIVAEQATELVEPVDDLPTTEIIADQPTMAAPLPAEAHANGDAQATELVTPPPIPTDDTHAPPHLMKPRLAQTRPPRSCTTLPKAPMGCA